MLIMRDFLIRYENNIAAILNMTAICGAFAAFTGIMRWTAMLLGAEFRFGRVDVEISILILIGAIAYFLLRVLGPWWNKNLRHWPGQKLQRNSADYS